MHIHLLDCTFNCRSTPVETLHTILLGPYKYLTRKVMTELSPRHKEEVLARMAAFHYSGFKNKVYGNITRYCKSFVGRDFKAWAQMALFIITPYLREEEATVWLNLTKVNVEMYLLYTSCMQFTCMLTFDEFLGIPDLLLPVLLSQQESRVGGNMPGLRQLRTSGVSQLYQQAQDSPGTAPGGVYGGVRTNCCIQHRKVRTILVLI